MDFNEPLSHLHLHPFQDLLNFLVLKHEPFLLDPWPYGFNPVHVVHLGDFAFLGM